MIRALTRVTVLAAIVAAGAVPASAQADFDGVWQPRYHEDQPERIPGPELRDYLGLPINDAARQFADSWDPAGLPSRRSSAGFTSLPISIEVPPTCGSGRSGTPRPRTSWP